MHRGTAPHRLFGDRAMTAQAEHEGRVEAACDSFRSFDLYATMREIAARSSTWIRYGGDRIQRMSLPARPEVLEGTPFSTRMPPIRGSAGRVPYPPGSFDGSRGMPWYRGGGREPRC